MNFGDKKRFLRSRRTDNPAVRKLLEADLTFLDRIQVQTAKEFLIIRLAMKRERGVPLRTA